MREREVLVQQHKESAIEIILAKHQNPSAALTPMFDQAGITPYYFYNEILNPKRLLEIAPQGKIRRLESILANEDFRKNLFKMDLNFLRKQYLDVQAGEIGRFVEGTFENVGNVEDLIYIAMISQSPLLHHSNRGIVREAILKLKPNMREYLEKTGIDRIIKTYRKREGPLHCSILELFDNARKRIKKDDSMFDLTKPIHLPLWDFWYGPLNSYWADPKRAADGAYYLLTKNMPILKKSREGAMEIASIPDKKGYFRKIGLQRLMRLGFNGKHADSIMAPVMAFDSGYQDATCDNSLFDYSKKHLHLWSKGFVVQNGYWNNMENRKEAVYHMLVEYDARFGNDDPNTAADALNSIKSYKSFFASLNLGGLMLKMGNSIEKMVRLYDDARKSRKQQSVIHLWNR